MASAGFYVYEHVRKDTGAVFYVGKGSRYRATVVQGRNRYWHRIVDKAGGYDVRLIASGLDEDLAFLAEMERIDQLRRLGVRLANMTDGGEGMAGYKMDADVVERRAAKRRGKKRPDISARLRGVKKTEEHKKNLSIARTGLKVSVEGRAKMSAARKGRPSATKGRTQSDAVKEKIRASVIQALQSKEVRERISVGVKAANADPEVRKKRAIATKKALSAEDVRRRMSDSHMGYRNWRYGNPIPEEQKARQIAALKARPRVTCQHCGKTMDEANAKRWHMDNCRDLDQ